MALSVRVGQLADNADLGNGSWRVTISGVESLTRDVVQAADGRPLSKHLVDFYVQDPQSSSFEERCDRERDACIHEILVKLPRQCLI